jgi:cell fate regulator YaaT (PSP1 superfamily)
MNQNMTNNETPTTTPEISMFDLPEWTGNYPEANQKPSPPDKKLVGVRFQPIGKVYHYDATGYDALKAKDWVIVDTARGRQMGQIATVNPPRDKVSGPFKRIERMATGRDMAMRHFYENKELEAMIACRAESAGLQLPIKIVRAEYSFDGQTLTFLYSTEEEDRVSTDALREQMSHLYQARIEMRQISPREVAKIIGGLGACGIAERCCSKFLTEFSPISIKHAKEQNLSLNPHDITGMCGRLRCCLVFEYEQYVAAKRTLPKQKSMIGTPEGQGKVIEVNTMRDTVIILFTNEDGTRREKEFHREQLVPLEELKRLQEKALSGTCDKHEGGGCDCGRAKSQEPRAKSQDELPSAAQSFIKANEAKQAEDDAKARAEAVRERIKKRRDERDVARESRRANEKQRRTEARAQTTGEPNAEGGTRGEAQPKPPQQPRQRDERRPPQGQPNQQERQHQRDQNRRGQPRPERPQQQSNPDASAGDASNTNTGQPNPQNQQQQQQQRRPLRKPLPKRKE